jgi:hypothetical protein
MIWNPWREIRRLRGEQRALALTIEMLRSDRDSWQHQAMLAADRYDKIRGMNLQLRDALELHRKA